MNRALLDAGTAALLTGAVLVTAAGPAAAARPTTWTTVEHDVVWEQRFDEDACGRGSHVERFHHEVSVNHLTQRPDGTFTFVDLETGSITLDFDDPSFADQVFRRTNTFTVTLTRGDVVTVNETFRQADRYATITYRLHLTLVDGVPVVEKEREQFVASCP